MTDTCFQIHPVDERFWYIQDGHVRCFLLSGPDCALLIDSCVSPGPLFELCRDLTGHDNITVLNTHGDGDHCANQGQFSSVYMNPADFDYYLHYSRLQQPGPLPTPLWEGSLFSDGLHQLEAIALPGHTPGSTAFLDRHSRRLFIGDVLNTGPVYMFGPCRNLTALIASLKRVAGLMDTFDTICCCHGDPFIPSQRLPEFIAGYEAICAGDGTDSPAPDHFPPSVRVWSSGPAKLFLERPAPNQ